MTSGRLVFLGAESKRVDIDTSVRVASVVLRKVEQGQSKFPHAQRSGLVH